MPAVLPARVLKCMVSCAAPAVLTHITRTSRCTGTCNANTPWRSQCRAFTDLQTGMATAGGSRMLQRSPRHALQLCSQPGRRLTGSRRKLQPLPQQRLPRQRQLRLRPPRRVARQPPPKTRRPPLLPLLRLRLSRPPTLLRWQQLRQQRKPRRWPQLRQQLQLPWGRMRSRMPFRQCEAAAGSTQTQVCGCRAVDGDHPSPGKDRSHVYLAGVSHVEQGSPCHLTWHPDALVLRCHHRHT